MQTKEVEAIEFHRIRVAAHIIPLSCCRVQPVLLTDQITDIGNEYVSKHQDVRVFVLKLNKFVYFSAT